MSRDAAGWCLVLDVHHPSGKLGVEHIGSVKVAGVTCPFQNNLAAARESPLLYLGIRTLGIIPASKRHDIVRLS
jgi:hypothetical protein